MGTSLSVIILAAGQGTRMKSDLPKVLHQIGHKPMLEHVVNVAFQINASDVCVVYGHGGDRVPNALSRLNVTWVEQSEQLGTGHAVEQAIPAINDDNIVLILYGDVPLITPDTLMRLIQISSRNELGLLTATLKNPTGYGRIIRDDSGKVIRIVEEKDAKEHEKKVTEINTGMIAANAGLMKKWLTQLENNNAQGEFYLTDVIATAVKEGITVITAEPKNEFEIMGVNNKVQLAELERIYQRQQAENFMFQGVTLLDPDRFDVRGELSVGKDVEIDINVIIEGTVKLGNRVSIGAGSVLRNVSIGDDVIIKPFSLIENASVASRCQIGPFARIRPDTVIAEDAHIGNFVEIKKSEIGQGSKINHLSYIGDTMVGRGVNIGAGTITCNYDGANKHRTVIGDNAFIGSNSQLVAPVEIGMGATIGAGSTITRDAPPGELTLSRAKQATINGWRRPERKKN